MTNHEICHCTRARSSQSLQFRLNLSGLLRWTVLALVEISIFNWFGHLERGRRRNLAQGQLTSWLVLFVAVPGYFPLNFDIFLPKNHQLNLYSCSPVQTFVGLRSLFPQAFRRRISNFWKKKKMLKFFFFYLFTKSNVSFLYAPVMLNLEKCEERGALAACGVFFFFFIRHFRANSRMLTYMERFGNLLPSSSDDPTWSCSTVWSLLCAWLILHALLE